MSGPAVRLNDRFVAQARTFSRATSLLVMLVGVLALAGWFLNAPVLQGFGGSITMKANAAVALMLAGASAALLHDSEHSTWSRRLGIASAVLVALLGAATLSEHLFGWNLGIDEILFTEAPGALATASPGRMGPPASTCFALAGAALILLHRGRAVVVAQSAAIAAGLMALLAITGYLYGVESLYGVARYTGIAAHTAVSLFLLSAALLTGSIHRGVAAVMAGEAAGSLMARRLLGFAIAGPLLLGWIRLVLESRGYFDVRFGVAALVLAIVVILATVIVRTAVRLNQAEQLRLADSAARKLAEEEREQLLVRESQARAEAEAANQAKDEFLATVSHELRTPLNAILGWTSMLRDRTIQDEATVDAALATIERNCRAQAQLIEDILDVSRIIAGKLLLDVKPVDLAGVIRSAIEAVHPAADARGVQLDVVIAPFPIQVRGDPTRLQQIVWNLLSNAVKFSHRDGTVEVRLTTDDGHAVVTVTDMGEGISPEFLPYVFERFRQADGGKTRRFSGLGLGLSIARSLAEMHGGTIEAMSLGRQLGATFIVRLPLFAAKSVATVQGDRLIVPAVPEQLS